MNLKVFHLKWQLFLLLSNLIFSEGCKAFIKNCIPSVTSMIINNQFSKPLTNLCSGELIFSDEFDCLDKEVWKLENSMGIGGGSKEFQWYVNDDNNAYAEDGILHIKPTLTADIFGEEFLYTGSVEIPSNQCTANIFSGCNRTGSLNNIINPIRSVRMNTYNSFSFKYGVVDIRAKMPTGDWLFPALWMNPRYTVYGPWPMSGEIDLIESRGNPFLFSGTTNVGVEQVASTLHFGPKANIDGWRSSNFRKNSKNGFDKDFHTYTLVWTETHFEFFVDYLRIGMIDATEGGFFKRSNFSTETYSDPWSNSSSPMAPFDQYFYPIINLAVGGTSFFSDGYVNKPQQKPWRNNSTRPMADFWEARDQWLPGWRLEDGDESHFQIDYIRIWAL